MGIQSTTINPCEYFEDLLIAEIKVQKSSFISVINAIWYVPYQISQVADGCLPLASVPMGDMKLYAIFSMNLIKI